MNDTPRGLVLAAGAGSRFGGGKLLAGIGGRPVLQHVLDALADARIEDVVVVLGRDSEAIEAGIAWRHERRVVNPEPERGLSSSLRVGFDALGSRAPDSRPILVALGDQPLTSSDVVRRLVDAPAESGKAIAVPVYAEDRGRNPVLIRPAAFDLIAETAGDRGLGPVLDAHPDLVTEVPVPGANPDVDTRADLARAIEASWAERVRANREQVERFRETPDGSDFYAPSTSLFRADPTRTDDPVLDAVLALVRPGETWLDVGAGAGRFALPIARALDGSGGSVIALDPSPSMLDGLRDIAEDYAIENVPVVVGRWPPADTRSVAEFEADVALIAHVGYDIEEIGPFVDALEAVTRRLCVAVMMERPPAAAASPFWPLVHGVERAALPALSEFVELLEARGRAPEVEMIGMAPRLFESRDALGGFVRRQLWIDPEGPKEAAFQAALDELVTEDGGGWTIKGRGAGDIGIVKWQPR